jgi:16S rRNA (guanine966-N2)-methyltransferase
MRVVAGIARGRPLAAPKGPATRPTSDRVREAVFSSLTSLDVLDGATVLDLFAGTGAMGIEALSRGATSATFVDDDPRAVATIKDNLRTTGFVDGGRVVRGDVLQWLGGGGARAADLAFVDPPYSFVDWDVLLKRLVTGMAVLESDRELVVPEPWEVVRSKRYGGTVVCLIRRLSAPRGS